jgi:putative endonuclease
MSSERPTAWSDARPVVPKAKRTRGKVAYLSGLAAEDTVLRAFKARGAELLERRWRGQAGEIDLIFLENGVYVFCEVKAAQSFEQAMERLRPAQIQRIHASAGEYLGHTPGGQLSEVRFDLAIVNGQGMCRVLDGAFSHF